MSKWIKSKFSDFLKIEMGQSPSSIHVNSEEIGIPLLNGPAEFTDRYPIPVQYSTEGTRIAEKGNILFCVRGSTTGRMNIANQKYIIGRGLAAISHKTDKYLNPFVKGLLDYNVKFLIGGTSGSVFPNLTKDQLHNYTCYIPSLFIQQKIASILSSLDDKIELNNKINAELEAMAKTIYDYWFVQFEFPNTEGKPYKSCGGKMVYNEQLKREIPEGWNVKTLGGWIENEKTGDWGKEQKEGNYTVKVSCIRGADINGINGKGDINCPERYILEKNSFKILEENEIVVEISGGSPTQSTGRMTYITKEVQDRFLNPLICSNFCKVVSLKNQDHIYVFTQLWQMLYNNNVFFGFEGKTSGIKNLLFDALTNSYNTVVPNDDTIKSFNKIYNPIYTKIQKNLKENEELASLRDWLLPMLMNGQVGFKEDRIEKKYEDVLFKKQDQRFEMWLSQQGAAARGDIDLSTLREIFDNMDEDDK